MLKKKTIHLKQKNLTPDLLHFNRKAKKKAIFGYASVENEDREKWINTVSNPYSPSSGQCRSSAVLSDGAQARGEQGGETQQGRGRGVQAVAAIL